MNRHEPNPEDLPELTADLRRLHGDDSPVPAERSQAILRAAHGRLARPNRWRIGWIASASAASAAAAVLAVVLLIQHGPRPQAPNAVATALDRKDLNGDGAVNILDAFLLARRIERSGPLPEAWDINGDGVIDQRDVDAIALAAVRLDAEGEVR